MSAGLPPKKNAAYTFTIGLVSVADATLLQIDPTLAAGDFKISIDGGAYADLATLPTVPQAGHAQVKIALSAAEMNGDDISIECIDAAGAQWAAKFIAIKTSAEQIGDSPATDANSRSRLSAWISMILGR